MPQLSVPRPEQGLVARHRDIAVALRHHGDDRRRFDSLLWTRTASHITTRLLSARTQARVIKKLIKHKICLIFIRFNKK